MLTPNDIMQAFKANCPKWQRYCLAALAIAYMKNSDCQMEIITVGAEKGEPALAMLVATGPSAKAVLDVHEATCAKGEGHEAS